MNPISKPDHNRASITLYCVIALNTRGKSGYTINRTEAAQVLANLLQIDRRAPMSWLRGEFKTHPVSRENFLKVVRAYRTKPGLESAREITELAVNLYGLEYKKAIELLDTADRETVPEQGDRFQLPEREDLVTAVIRLIESSSAEEARNVHLLLIMHQWLSRDSQRGRLLT